MKALEFKRLKTTAEYDDQGCDVGGCLWLMFTVFYTICLPGNFVVFIGFHPTPLFLNCIISIFYFL